MERTQEVQEFVDGITKQLFGRSQIESAAQQACVICGGPADAFKDEISRREYSISRMCQKCQDETFG